MPLGIIGLYLEHLTCSGPQWAGADRKAAAVSRVAGSGAGRQEHEGPQSLATTQSGTEPLIGNPSIRSVRKKNHMGRVGGHWELVELHIYMLYM